MRRELERLINYVIESSSVIAVHPTVACDALLAQNNDLKRFA